MATTTDDRLAADLLEEICLRSGLKPSELARRAGLDRSVLSAYSHGRRQPSVAALARIARSAGLQLELSPAADLESLERQAKILEMVLDLAWSLPFKGRGRLEYPPLIRLRA
ncbi:MAG TPA: helix-turn-helix transcriptional regulator [Solirubrobacteraceae bacterium]|nr:helix-turn-helix transcriptional regulator [Solirubrobacteraceae bacterium]